MYQNRPEFCHLVKRKIENGIKFSYCVGNSKGKVTKGKLGKK